MAFNGTYVMEKEIGKADDMVVELGHYEDNGKKFDSKVYVFSTYTKKDGTSGRQSVAKFTVNQAKAFADLVKEI